MKSEDLILFRKQLLQKLKTLTGDIDVLENGVMRSKKDSATLDISKFADLGSDNYEVEFEMGVLETENGEIREILDALRRIDAGTFGQCTRCSKKINPSRLKAIPYARLCVDCKQAEEDNGAVQ